MRDGCRLGLDSHADTTCVGRHAAILEVIEGQTVEAVPFAKSIGSVSNLPIVNAALAYDHPLDGQTYILVCNQAIYLGEESDNCLLCPNQCRSHGVVIDDRPPEFEPKSDFSIHVPEEEVTFPLNRYGPTSYLRVRRPTKLELEECTHIELTEDSTWDPYGEMGDDPRFDLLKLESIIRENNTEKTFHSNIQCTEHPFDQHIMWNSFGTEAESHRVINSMKVKYGKEATPEKLAAIWG